MANDELKNGISRAVAHLAREYGVNQTSVWAEMYVESLTQITLKT